MPNRQKIARQLSFTDEANRRKRQRQERCKHKFVTVPIAFDEKLDEVYETVACRKCGYCPND